MSNMDEPKLPEWQKRMKLQVSDKLEDKVALMQLYEQEGGASLWNAAGEARKLGYVDVTKACALQGLQLSFRKMTYALDGQMNCAPEDLSSWEGLARDAEDHILRFATQLHLISKETNDFQMEKFVSEIQHSPSYINMKHRRDEKQGHPIPFNVVYATEWAAKQRLEMLRNKSIVPYRIGRLSPNLSKDTYRRDLLDRLHSFQGLTSVNLYKN